MTPVPTPRPEWARPDHVLGAPVSINLLLGRSATAAVRVRHVTAFPNGVEFTVVAHCRPTGEGWDPMHGLAGLRGRPGDRDGEISDDHIRLRIRFADGSEVDNLGPPMREPAAPRPFLHAGEGGADRSRAHITYWLGPLPPPGPLAVTCEWPQQGIAPTTHEVDAGLIREAAGRAIDLWPEDG